MDRALRIIVSDDRSSMGNVGGTESTAHVDSIGFGF